MLSHCSTSNVCICEFDESPGLKLVTGERHQGALYLLSLTRSQQFPINLVLCTVGLAGQIWDIYDAAGRLEKRHVGKRDCIQLSKEFPDEANVAVSNHRPGR